MLLLPGSAPVPATMKSILLSYRSAAERTFTRAKTQSRTTCTSVLGIYGATSCQPTRVKKNANGGIWLLKFSIFPVKNVFSFRAVFSQHLCLASQGTASRLHVHGLDAAADPQRAIRGPEQGLESPNKSVAWPSKPISVQ